MSFSFQGTNADSLIIVDPPNLPANTGAATVCFWVKRTGTWTGRKYLATMRAASTGNSLHVNSPGNTVTYGFLVDANYGASEGYVNESLASNVWVFVALVGSGANWSLKVWDTDTSAFLSSTVGQTSFAPTVLFIGGDYGYTGQQFTGLVAHIRIWNVALTDAELTAEKNSEIRVRQSGSLSAHSGGGGTLTAALTGQVGAALSNAGAVTYNADMPSFATFTGTVISGTAVMPIADLTSTPSGTSRNNRILWSDNLNVAPWVRDGHTADAPSSAAAPAGNGTAHRLTLTSTTGGFYQPLPNLPLGGGMCSCRVRRVNCDRFTIRHLGDGIANGATVVFNIVTGRLDSIIYHGGVTANGSTYGIRALTNGWWLVYLGVHQGITGSDRVFGFYPTSSDNPSRLITGNATDFAGPQYEDNDGGRYATAYKATTSVVVTRSLASISVELASPTSAINQSALATMQLLDGQGGPWDQFTPTGFSSSDTTKATVSAGSAMTDFSGRNTGTVVGVATGTSQITAFAGSGTSILTSSPKTVTVSGTYVLRYVDVRAEYGWGGTSGWFAGVYRKHQSQRFPTDKLFEVTGQSFTHVQGQSEMRISVPAGVTLAAGEQVDVVLENDNIDGAAVDGPGLFTARVI